MKLLNFNIIKLTICLIIGIIFAHFSEIPLKLSWILNVTFLLILTTTFLIIRNHFKQNSFFGAITFISTTLIGILVYNLHDEKLYSTDYTYSKIEDSIPKQITIQIEERLKPGNYHEKYTAKILRLNGKKVTGKILLNIPKDSLLQLYKTDDVMVSMVTFKTLSDPLNPYQFNYREYLEKLGIYHQIFIQNNDLILLRSEPKSLCGYADRIRNIINEKLKKYPFTKDQVALINALFLGQRQDIAKEIYENYTNAGTVHILAISGLHIGIILLILQFLLKPLEYLNQGTVFKTILIILLLWVFAIIAGLSASVTRSAAMFMVFAIAMNLKRPTNVYNTIAISMFLILLMKPKLLFDVGFQLSYLAVLGIVSVQPMLYKLINRPRYWILNKLWEVTTVTLAAQFGILPLSLYYFHQFPGLFFLSNLIIVPTLGLILGLGIIVIILAIFNLLPEFLVTAFGTVINYMNYFVGWVANKEDFLIRNISFSIHEVIASYLLILGGILFFKKMNSKTFIVFLISIVCFQSIFLWKEYYVHPVEFIVFHKSRHTLIGYAAEGSVTFYHNLENLNHERIVDDYIVGSYSKIVKEDSIRPIYNFNGKTIFVVDSFGIYQVKSFKPNIVMLRNSPKINLNRLIDSLSPTQIVADGSNYKSYINRWKNTCRKRKLPFHNTNEKGAFILK